jgi:hypothetical protein
MAEQVAKELKKSGATVKRATYDGGHGWRGALYVHTHANLSSTARHALRDGTGAKHAP